MRSKDYAPQPRGYVSRVITGPNSAKGAKYESQGQARSEAKRVAPGKRVGYQVEP